MRRNISTFPKAIVGVQFLHAGAALSRVGRWRFASRLTPHASPS
jgi:hypothetical protein